MVKIQLRKPDFKAYKKEGLAAVDMHCHSEHSHDSSMPLSSILQKMKEYGFGVALTDHNAVSGTKKLRENKESLIIPGVEVTTYENKDLLLYFNNHNDLCSFYDRHITPNIIRKKTNTFRMRTTLSMHYVLDIAADYNALRILPHPMTRVKGVYRTLKRRNDFSIIKAVDGIEAINSSQSTNWNIESSEWALSVKKGVTGGSDSHIISTLGNAVTIARAETAEEFLEEIRKRRNSVTGLSNDMRTEIRALGHIMKNKMQLSEERETSN